MATTSLRFPNCAAARKANRKRCGPGKTFAMRWIQAAASSSSPRRPSAQAYGPPEHADRELHTMLDDIVQKRLGIVAAQARVVARTDAENELRALDVHEERIALFGWSAGRSEQRRRGRKIAAQACARTLKLTDASDRPPRSPLALEGNGRTKVLARRLHFPQPNGVERDLTVRLASRCRRRLTRPAASRARSAWIRQPSRSPRIAATLNRA